MSLLVRGERKRAASGGPLLNILADEALLNSYTVPSSIDDTDTTDVTSALNAWLATVPDNAVAALSRGKTYRVEGTISLPTRTNLTFDLNGSTLHCHAAPTESQPMVKMADGSGVHVRNGTLTASYASPGTFTSAVEHAHGVMVVGTTSAEIDHLTMNNFAGDAIYWGLSETGSNTRSSGTDHHNTINGTGRNGVSYVACHNVTSTNHTISNIGLYAFDVEPNTGAAFTVDHVTVDTHTLHACRSYQLAIIENNTVDSITFSNMVCDDVNGFRVLISDALGNPIYRPTNVTISGLSSPTQYSNPYAWAIKHVDGLTVTSNDIPLWNSSNPSYVCLVEDCTSVTKSSNTISFNDGPFAPGQFFQVTSPAAGSVAATSTVSGAAGIITSGTAFPAAGTVAGTSAVSGTPTLRAVIAGASPGTSTAAGAVTSRLPATGTAVAASTTTGTIGLATTASSIAAATSTTTGAVTAILPTTGTVAGTSTVTGTLGQIQSASGAVAGTSTTTGAVTSRLPSTGSAVGVSAASGAVTSRLPATGAVAGVSTVSGTAGLNAATSTFPAAGTVAATSSSSGSVTLRASATGSVLATSSTTGAVTARLVSTGTTSATSSVTGQPTARLATVGTLAALSNTAATTALLATVSGTVAAVSDAAGTATGTTGQHDITATAAVLANRYTARVLHGPHTASVIANTSRTAEVIPPPRTATLIATNERPPL